MTDFAGLITMCYHKNELNRQRNSLRFKLLRAYGKKALYKHNIINNSKEYEAALKSIYDLHCQKFRTILASKELMKEIKKYKKESSYAIKFIWDKSGYINGIKVYDFYKNVWITKVSSKYDLVKQYEEAEMFRILGLGA